MNGHSITRERKQRNNADGRADVREKRERQQTWRLLCSQLVSCRLVHSALEMLRSLRLRDDPTALALAADRHAVPLLRAAAQLAVCDRHSPSASASDCSNRRTPHSLFCLCLEEIDSLAEQNALVVDVQRLGGTRALASFVTLPVHTIRRALALSSPLSFLAPAVCSHYVQQTVEITLDLCATCTCESVDASGSTCGLEMNECTFEQLLALALNLLLLFACRRSLATNAILAVAVGSAATSLPLVSECRSLRRPSTPASHFSLQSRGVNRAGPKRAGPGRAERFYNLLGIRAEFLQSFTRTNCLTN